MPSWTPHNYQLKAVEWVVTRGASGLMLNPGMGKTSSVLAAIVVMRASKHIRKTLVVAPLRVAKTVWPPEVQKWDDFRHLKIVHLCEMDDNKRKTLLDQNYDIYVINPESLKFVLPLLTNDFDLLVVDESTKFKDYSTQRFKILKKYLSRFKRRIIMTGTPAPNGLEDLFGQIYILDQGNALGRYITHFRMEYFVQDPFQEHVRRPSKGAEESIYNKLSNLLIRMDPKDHLQMPELINVYTKVDLPTAVAKVYRQMENDLFTIVNEDPVFGVNAAVAGSKCRQIGNGFLYGSEGDGSYHVLHDEKMDALEELVEEMQGRPLFVLYEYIADRKRILARFPQAVDITTTKNLQKVIDDFNAGTLPMLIAHPKSAGHGLNLQGSCDTVAWFGVTWDLELYLQSIARIWRQGNPNPTVVVHHLMANTQIDDTVVKALAAKDRTQNTFLNGLRELAKSFVAA